MVKEVLFSGMTQMLSEAWTQVREVSAPLAAHSGGAWRDPGTAFGQVDNSSMVCALT